MGQSTSTLPSSLPTSALHILRVADNSPAQPHLEPFFDYLVSLDIPSAPQSQSELTPASLARLLEDHEGTEVGLRVYNAKSQRIRGTSSSSLPSLSHYPY
jgi:hypothetical protein